MFQVYLDIFNRKQDKMLIKKMTLKPVEREMIY